MKRIIAKYGLLVAALSSVRCGESSDAGPAEGNGGDAGSAVVTGSGAGGSSAGGNPTGAGGAGSGTGGSAGNNAAGTTGTGGASSLPDAGRDGGGSLGKSPFDWVGVIGSGQSLSTGCCDGIPLSTTQPFKNLKLVDSGPDPKYPTDGTATAMWATAPLTEPFRPWLQGYGTCSYPPDNCQYPNNVFKNGETPHSAMANTLSAMWRAQGSDYVTAHSLVGVGGALLMYINKGNGSYKAGLSETRVFNQLAKAAGKTYGVGGIIFTHGESDAGTPDYEAGVYKFWQDYNTDLKAITGQTRDIVLIGSQQSTTATQGDSSAVQLWRGGVDHPGQIICAGPKYQYTYLDGLHLPGAGSMRLGEKYAEVFDLVVNKDVAWKPLGPSKVTRAGAVITIDMDVPNPPLVWDETIGTPHKMGPHTAWANGRGFEVVDAAGTEIAIASAEIKGNSVVLTLMQAPAAGTMLKVRYATVNGYGQSFPNGSYPRGQLRDSDEFVGYDAEKIQVQVTSGMTQVKGATGAFARRTGRDVVTGTGLAAGTIVVSMMADTMTLSAPWTGASGMAELSFHHDLHNYCVHFSMAVP
jgi:hypothetical protein